MSLIKQERPSGHQVQALREGVGLTREEFADHLHEKVQNVKNWETEKQGRLMPASTWLLARITCDALAFELWKRLRPKVPKPQQEESQ